MIDQPICKTCNGTGVVDVDIGPDDVEQHPCPDCCEHNYEPVVMFVCRHCDKSKRAL